ncbi:hypothetical protein mRhiFer1_008685 [Rhinolophus ferrumequinum]|uniref:Uncharacterized protein n=1 Tax=Rhinolophus ferrumequinum TaxID=59479 RepID=A0A7J7TQ65_RHIFE|nr:hypothetical protein mRhiFer1_008685 [Rhinolophus ferrumequinum]
MVVFSLGTHWSSGSFSGSPSPGSRVWQELQVCLTLCHLKNWKCSEYPAGTGRRQDEASPSCQLTEDPVRHHVTTPHFGRHAFPWSRDKTANMKETAFWSPSWQMNPRGASQASTQRARMSTPHPGQ